MSRSIASRISQWSLGLLCAAALTTAPAWAQSEAGGASKVPIWPKVRNSLFGTHEIIEDGGSVIQLEAPVRAEDASTVPIAMHTQLLQTPDRYVDKLYLIVDNNPSPIAAIFQFTPESGKADIETRIRVEQYTDVRAIAELNDGSLYMATRFVKASGGCSAPAGKDAEAAARNLGKVKFNVESGLVPGKPALAQLAISHPNASGLVLDQITRLYAPAYYVRKIAVSYAGKPVLTADVDFSISENPNFRFYFLPTGEGELKAEIVDTKDLTFEKSVPVHAARP